MVKAAKKCLFYYLRPIFNTIKFKTLYSAIMSILKLVRNIPQDDRIDRKLENISFLQVFFLPRANV